ncbi:MAG: radical SAM family heme chaperone HemW [Holosporales bacterium]|jgi:oxygen-independent coproporphyrinogen-3 oxidase|nr:radical SAM family heme chaperone HemW [Holosporales bacterium]
MNQYGITDNSISIYIHWPFCLSKCPYCSFNSYQINDILNFEHWKLAYFFSLNKMAESTDSRIVRSIYFGGGTPSLLPTWFIEAILLKIQSLWTIDSNVEVSIEINPTTATSVYMNNLKTVGINRVSIGVQSFSDTGLTVLGRTHTVKDSINTISLCAKFFPNHSLDLIYAWPSHTPESWRSELQMAVSFGTPHLSLYQLMIEDNSVFGSMYTRGELLVPDENVCVDMFETAQRITEQAKLPAYEVSNHACLGFECIHNIIYWIYKDYIGVGPGAHSHITINQKKYAIVQESNPRKWLKIILNNQFIPSTSECLSEKEQAREAILVGLRTVQGVDCNALPTSLASVINNDAYTHLVQRKFLIYKKGVLKATYKGRKRLNAMLTYLLK